MAVAVVGFTIRGYHDGFVEEKVGEPEAAADGTKPVLWFALTHSGDVINCIEHEERVARYKSTQVMHFNDW